MIQAEARQRRQWLPLARGGAEPPRVLETEAIELRGLQGFRRVTVGLTSCEVDAYGEVSLRPATDVHLSGHVGVVEVTADDGLVGELEIVPDKMSEDAYRILRADLQKVWTDLIFDPLGRTSTRAAMPSARELWRRVDAPIARIVAHPAEQLVVGVAHRRLERVRRARELRPAVVRAGLQGRSAQVATLERTTATPENRMVGSALRLLRSHARRDPSAADIVSRVDRLLRTDLFSEPARQVQRVTWGMRSDPRYRQVLAVYQALSRPELESTEGPGELRLGIPALARLYEYWVYLKVLEMAAERYGPPQGAGFGALAVSTGRSRRRLELPAGTTVMFPGGVHIAFEPRITSRGDGWMGIEYVPHPDPKRQQLVATPDVVIYRAGDDPEMVVIDAKYVGRPFVEWEAAKMHEKYARMRFRGRPVVRNVIVAHPHEGLSTQWAGYGHVVALPGQVLGPLPLPEAPPRAAPPVD